MVQTNIMQDRLQELFPVHYRNGNILMINADCMEVMKHIKDNEVELSCVDPPYGIGIGKMNYVTSGAKKIGKAYRRDYRGQGQWDGATPGKEYFDELTRVSVNQIVWGGNYFADKLDISKSWIIWDKKTEDKYANDFADCELAWASCGTVARIFRFMWSGMLQGNMKNKESRIHPTQKPVALYKWLLSRYAKPGDRILDTHGGSGSICIACHDLGFDLTWMELDEDYYKAACERYQNHAAQCNLFDQKTIEKTEQGTLF